MDLIKDFLISAFFEAALASLWVGALAIAWCRNREFVEEPLDTAARTVGALWSKVKEQEPSRVLYLVFVLVICFYLVGTVMQRLSDDFVETTSTWMPKPAEEYEAFGTDEEVRNEVMEDYRHLLAQDYELLQKARLNMDEAKMGKVIRDSRTRRAFSREGSGSYMQRLLEPVRICQATLMHSFLLSFILFSLAVVVWADQLFRQRPRARLLAFWGWAIALLGWTFCLAPKLHDPDEYNYPVLSIFMLILVFLIPVGEKILLRQEGEPARQWRDRRFTPVYQLLLAAVAALVFCYWSTFSWFENRENFTEAALALGGEASDASPDVPPSSPPQSR